MTTEYYSDDLKIFISWISRFDRAFGLNFSEDNIITLATFVFEKLMATHWKGSEFSVSQEMLAGGDDLLTDSIWSFFCDYFINCGSSLHAREMLLFLPAGLKIACCSIWASGEIYHGGFGYMFEYSDARINAIVTASVRLIGTTRHVEIFDRSIDILNSDLNANEQAEEYSLITDLLYQYEAETGEFLGLRTAKWVRKNVLSCEFTHSDFSRYKMNRPH